MEPRPTEHVEQVQARHIAAAKEAEAATSEDDPRDRTHLPGSARAPGYGSRSQLQSRQQRVGSPRRALMNRNKPPPPPLMKFVHHKDTHQYVEDYVRHVSQGIMCTSSARSPFEPQPLFSAKQVTSMPSPQGVDAYHAHQLHNSPPQQEATDPVRHDHQQQAYQQHREEFHRFRQHQEQQLQQHPHTQMWEYMPPQSAASSNPHIIWQ